MGRRFVVAFWVLVVATAAGTAVATVRADDAKSRCTHGASSIGPVTIANGKVVGGSTVPHTQACLP